MPKTVEMLLNFFMSILLLFVPMLLLSMFGFLGYNIYAHAYLQDSPRWCTWCDMVTVFEGDTKLYKNNIRLCREHMTKAVILGEAGKLVQDIER